MTSNVWFKFGLDSRCRCSSPRPARAKPRAGTSPGLVSINSPVTVVTSSTQISVRIWCHPYWCSVVQQKAKRYEFEDFFKKYSNDNWHIFQGSRYCFYTFFLRYSNDNWHTSSMVPGSAFTQNFTNWQIVCSCEKDLIRLTVPFVTRRTKPLIIYSGIVM